MAISVRASSTFKFDWTFASFILHHQNDQTSARVQYSSRCFRSLSTGGFSSDDGVLLQTLLFYLLMSHSTFASFSSGPATYRCLIDGDSAGFR